VLSFTLQDAHFFIFTKSLIEEKQLQHQYELARFQAFLTLTPNLDSKKKPTAKKLYTFPWEEEEDRKEYVYNFPEEMYSGFEQLFDNHREKLKKRKSK
jgi:hypothetical protein